MGDPVVEQPKGWRDGGPEVEVELVEVVPVDDAARRRRLLAGVGTLVVLTGVVAWAVVVGVDAPQDESATRVAAAAVDTDGGATVVTESPAPSLDSVVFETVVTSSPTSESVPATVKPPTPTSPGNSGGYSYADLVDALQRDDQAAVDAFCAAHPAPAWHLPNFVGRSVQNPLTSSERAAAVWVTGCYHLFDGKITINTNTIISARRECTSDPTLVDIIFWQEEAAGSVYQTPNHILRLAAYTLCETPPTTTVPTIDTAP